MSFPDEMKRPKLSSAQVPTSEEFARLHEILNRTSATAIIAATDFDHARARLAEDDSQSQRRSVVRCFGSLVDGFSAAMMETAVQLADMWRRPLNQFLQAKSREREISALHRIKVSYRLVGELLPESPLRELSDERCAELLNAISLRNRILHPQTAEDLHVTSEALVVLIKAADNCVKDYVGFCHWAPKMTQDRMWDSGGQRRYIIEKTGRNEPCPCKSGKKYKQCCGMP